MAEVSDINKNIPHRAEEVVCIKCLRRWIAVYPDGTWLKDLECQNCGPGFVILTGEENEL